MSRLLPLATAESAENWPGVTVIVAVRNGAATLARAIEALRALDYPEVEVIVVDDHSTDETLAIASATGVRVLQSARQGPSAARNIGIERATHDIVAFTDADCLVPRHWLRVLVEALRSSRAAGVGSSQRNVFPTAADRRARDLDLFFALASVVAEYTRGDDAARFVDHNASCNVAYIKHTLTEAGGFAEDLFPGEDVDLDLRLHRLGYRCYYVPGAQVEHHRPGTREWFARMMWRYGRAQKQLVERHGRFRTLHYLPVVLVGLAALQLLWLPRRTRPLVAGADGLLIAATASLLATRVPLRHWPTVLDYSFLAVTAWISGYHHRGRPR